MTESEEPASVFLSYSHRDRAVAKGLADELRVAGVPVELEDELLTPGADWQAQVRHAMARSSAIIVLIGQGSSTQERSEWRMALDSAFEEDRPILPVVISDAATPAWAERFQVVRLPDEGADASAWPDLILDIRRSLQEPEPPTTVPEKSWNTLRRRLDAVVREAQALDS